MNWDLQILVKCLAGKVIAQSGLVLIVTDQKGYPAPEKSCGSKALEDCFVLNLFFIPGIPKQTLGASSAHFIQIIGYGRIILLHVLNLQLLLNVKINIWI